MPYRQWSGQGLELKRQAAHLARGSNFRGRRQLGGRPGLNRIMDTMGDDEFLDPVQPA